MLKLKHYWILSLILCLCAVMTACRSGKEAAASVSLTESAEGRSESVQSLTESAEGRTESAEGLTESAEGRTESAPGMIPGTYAVPEGWVKDDRYSTSRKIFYVKAGHEKDKKPDNISINVGKNHYSLDQQTEFREAIVNQLLTQLKGTDSQLDGTGTYTKQEYPLYIFTIEDPDAETRQYYIVDNYRFCLIHLTNYTGDKEDDEVAQAMADSFVWDSPGDTE